MNNKDELIYKIATILGVTVNMVRNRLSLEDQIVMLVEQYERMEEYYKENSWTEIPHD